MVVAGCRRRRRFCCGRGGRSLFLLLLQGRFQIEPSLLLPETRLFQLHYDIHALAADGHFDDALGRSPAAEPCIFSGRLNFYCGPIMPRTNQHNTSDTTRRESPYTEY